jgi:nitroimidazol reductase NimA-like FMN-containing flavoprotein (pyridoxamine 5'-phosphate oxidase superfamily)
MVTVALAAVTVGATMADEDNAAVAKAIIDANLYMVLATADRDCNPWVSPVYYAPDGYRDFFWVSRPEARHSRNLSARAGGEIAIVIFDSSVPIDTGQAVYLVPGHGVRALHPR